MNQEHPQSSTRVSIVDRLAKYHRPQWLSPAPMAEGQITRLVGLTLEAVGLNVSIGCQCHVVIDASHTIEAEVVGFAHGKTFLMPVRKFSGLQPGARVIPLSERPYLPVGYRLLGRVIDGLGQPLDGLGSIQTEAMMNWSTPVINPLHRRPIDTVLDVGIRSINSLLTVGQGQRLGLFAGSGVGKSVLMGMMTRFTEADVVVVGLIGERGREVKEFIDQILGPEGLKRAIVVAAPADEAPLMRLKAAELSTRIAEYFRDRGQRVLLLIDSLTRFAQAQREIALAVGEPPATKGYPPSVFGKIPQLVERAGNGDTDVGSITAFYTVLTEGDDLQDPIADAARAILDGHIVLSRQLAEEGIYPAVDIEASVSRVMPNIIDLEHLQQAQIFKQCLARYRNNKDLIAVGAYKTGADPQTDWAIERFPHLMEFLRQSMTTPANFAASCHQLSTMLKPPTATDAQARRENN